MLRHWCNIGSAELSAAAAAAAAQLPPPAGGRRQSDKKLRQAGGECSAKLEPKWPQGPPKASWRSTLPPDTVGGSC